MYPISDALRRRFENDEKKSIRITSDSATAYGLIITESDIISNSFSIDRYCVTGNKIEVGSAVAAELSLTINNADGKFNDYIFEGAELFVEIGIAGTTNSYIPCGKFTVDEPPRDNMRISLKALDFMMLFDKKANLSLIPFPCNAETLIRRISEICGVTVSSAINFSGFANCDETLYSPTAEVTYRQLLQWACEILGVCAYMDHIGELMLSWYKDTAVNITSAVRYSGNILEKDIEISGVTVKTQSGSFVSGTEDYPIIIEGNSLIYGGTEQFKADNIRSAIGAFKYRSYECSCMPMPYLYPLDKITYTDKNGNVISTVITNHTFGLNSVSNLSAKGETAQQKNYSQEKAPTKTEIDAIIAEAMKKISSTAEKLYVMYSAYPNGMNGEKTSMTPDVKTDSLYIGTCVTTANEAPKEASSYKWVKIRGEDGQDGEDGDPGRGVVSIKTQYYRSTSSTTQTGGSWSYDMPEWIDGTYLWKREVTAFENPAGTEYGTPVLDTSWEALGDLNKNISATEQASKDLNETLANALGLYVTETTVSGSKIRYYHTNPILSASKSGDTILVLNSSGFGVCTTGWNGGNPFFQNGMDFGQGKAIWNILVANKINADLIEAGVIKSLATAGVQTKLDLETGVMTFDTGDTLVSVKGAEKNANGVSYDAGVILEDKDTQNYFGLSLSGLYYMTSSYALDLIKYLLGMTNKKPEDPYYSEVGEQHIKTKTIHCQDVYILGRNDNSEERTEQSLFEVILTLNESLTRLQEKYLALEEALGQQHEHTAASAVRENIVEATCESGGSYDSVVYCATCGEEISRTPITTTKLGHDWHSVVTPPTTESEGYTTHTCRRCNESYTDNHKDKLPAETALARVRISDGGAGDFAYMSDAVNGSNLGSEKSYVSGQTMYFHAEAKSGKKISKLVVNVTQSTEYTAEQLASINYLNADYTVLNFPLPVVASYLGKTITATVYFAEPSSGGGSDIGSNEVRIITSIGGGLAGVPAPSICDEEGTALGTDMIVAVDSGVYIGAGAADGWVVSSVSVYLDGNFVGSQSSADMGDALFADNIYFTQPVLTNYAGHTIEYKFYFKQA